MWNKKKHLRVPYKWYKNEQTFGVKFSGIKAVDFLVDLLIEATGALKNIYDAKIVKRLSHGTNTL